VKLRSPVAPRKARIEIIPLIDIMFFLLACFMLVSLSMLQMRGMKVALPTAATATAENKSDFFAVTLDNLGNLYLEKEAVTKATLAERARAAAGANPEARFYIRADENATHGEVVRVLDELKQAGIQHVSFELKAQSITGPASTPAPAGVAAPTGPAAPPAPSEPAAN
jgi:biopolymer transport protein ExbD